MNTLLVATKNDFKLKEIQSLLSIVDNLQVISLKEIHCQVPEISETGKTFIENAIIKATTIAHLTNYIALADDSGLSIDALHGEPGVFSARFGGESKDDALNRRKVLSLMRTVAYAERSAHFVCAMALATPHSLINVVEGCCHGFIAEEDKGTNGFGYDPIFIYPPLDKTFGEIDSDIKNKVSHRANALNKMQNVIANFFMAKEKP